MATKIRLQRHGKKGKPYYHIVAADARAKRDGRYIERIGNYNPNTNPATIELQFDRAVYWLGVGAQPTDTAKAILSYEGAVYMNHLLKGVAKGALTEEHAQKKFEAWKSEKAGKIQSKKDGLSKAADKANAERLAAEKAVSDKRAQAIAATQSELAAEAQAASEAASAALTESAEAATEGAEEVVAEATTTEEGAASNESAADKPAAEETPAEKPKAEAAEETPAEGEAEA